MTRRAVRHRSRRRLAALAFLSNISLDGTYRDTKISGLAARRPPAGAEAGCENLAHAERTDTVDGPVQTTVATPVVETITANKLRRQSSADASDIQRRGTNPESTATAPRRQRCQTVGAEPGESLLRRLVPGVDAPGPAASSCSCESVCGSVRSGHPCSSVSELSAPAVRLARQRSGIAGSGACEERLVLVGAARLPVLVLSLLTAGRPSAARHVPVRRERQERVEAASRRRYNSGSRGAPLAPIADRTDAFSLLGMEPLAEGQEVSFSQFLHPSTPPPTGRRQLSLERDREVESLHPRHAPPLNRCVSHEPQMHRRGPVEPAPSVGVSLDRAIDEAAPSSEPAIVGYHPLLLDNPETQSENHRTVLTFRSYRASIIDYMKPSELKRTANERFRQRFPHVQLTLSKLRSLKRDLRRTATDCRIDLLSVAQAHVYFEKLVLRGLVNKANRKLVAGACLLLAAKMNDVKGDMMSQLVERIEAVLRLQRRELFSCELGVLVALQFALHLQLADIEPHLRRLQA